MNEKLQEAIFKKYPEIFKQRNMKVEESCMARGIQCGNGWFNIIDVLCHSIKTYISQNTKSCSNNQHKVRLIPTNRTSLTFEAAQIKEKYGALRFYYDGGDDIIAGMIRYAEALSLVTCSICGAPAKAYSSGWLSTLCDDCKRKKCNNGSSDEKIS